MARKKVIITCAVTGSVHTPSMSPYLPVTPDQIAAEAIAAAEAGAAILHLHARDPANGRPSADPDVFMQFLPRIKQATDAVINITTGGSSLMTLDQRLAAPLRAQPEMCSLNMGSMNFALFPMLDKPREWQQEWEPKLLEATRETIFKNTFGDMETVLEKLGRGCGARFEFECYDVGHLYSLAHFRDRGLVSGPFFIQFVFGILGGGANPDNLVHMKRIADKLFGDAYSFSVLAAGRHQMPMISMAAAMGGNVRVGLEDSLYDGRALAKSNADQVRRIRTVLDALSLDVATPAEAREMLSLKGGDKVASKVPADGIAIRRAGLADAGLLHAAVVSLSRYVDDEDQVLSSVDDFRRFGKQPAFFAEIAEIGGEFAGMCLHFPIFSTWMGRPGVYVQDLYVEKQFRGRRIGEHLLRHVARLSRAAGGVYLRLSVDADNVNAQAFYASIGVARSEYEQVHKITGEAFAAFCDEGEDRP